MVTKNKSLADGIREYSRKKATVSQPIGAGTLAPQAHVSATGKAAPTAPLAQSNVASSIEAAKTEAELENVSKATQEEGEALAVKEKAADVKQAGIESDMAMRKLASDNKFNNELADMASKVKMAKTDNEREMAAFEMREFIRNKNLDNTRYKDAIEAAGERNGLKSMEDFAIAMSEQGLERGKANIESQKALEEFKNDYARDKGYQVSMKEVYAAIDQMNADAKAQTQAAGATAFATTAKTGADAYSTDASKKKKWGWGMGEDKPEEYENGLV
jgi:hypothetical protein